MYVRVDHALELLRVDADHLDAEDALLAPVSLQQGERLQRTRTVAGLGGTLRRVHGGEWDRFGGHRRRFQGVREEG